MDENSRAGLGPDWKVMGGAAQGPLRIILTKRAVASQFAFGSKVAGRA